MLGWGRAALAAALAGAMVGFVGGAAAQDGGEVTPVPESDPAWYLFEEATSALESGRKDEARRLLRALVAGFPTHPAGQRGAALLASLGDAEASPAVEVATPPPAYADDLAAPPPDTPVPAAPGAPPAVAPPPSPLLAPPQPAPPEPPPEHRRARPPPETPQNGNRIELVVFQTVNGFALGIESCFIVDCDQDRQFFGAYLLGAAVGFGLSFGLTTDGVRPGTSASLNTGFVLGLWHAGALVAITQPDETAQRAGALMAGQLAGVGIGALLDAAFEPTEGRVLMARAGGLWTSAFTGLLVGALGPDVERSALFASMLIAGDLAFILAGTAGYDALQMSRSRVLITSLIGMAGSAIGMSLAYAFGDSSGSGPDDLRPVWGTGAAGMLAGLILGAVLTSGRKERIAGEGPPPTFAVTPTEGGVVARLGLRF